LTYLIPPEIIEEIIHRTDLVELIGRYVPLKKTGRNFVGLCPFHAEDTPSFTVTPDKDIFYCFGCQKGGNAINFLMEMENLPFVDATEMLAKSVGLDIPEKPLSAMERSQNEHKKNLLDIHKRAAEIMAVNLWESKTGRQALDYLYRRDLDDETIRRFNLGWAKDDFSALTSRLLADGFNEKQLMDAGLAGKSEKNGRLFDYFRGRVMFPITDYKGQVIAFGGRLLGDGHPKYLNSSETLLFDKSKNLYGLREAASSIRTMGQAILMEGYLDVITAHRLGVTNAVATLGTALNPNHGALLRRYATDVLLSYDGDQAGQKAALRGLQILHEQGFTLKVLTLPGGCDPDDFLRQNGKEVWDELLREKALGLLEYKLQVALNKRDSSTVAGKGAVITELLPDIAACRSHAERDAFITLLASRLGVSPQAIYQDLAHLKRPTGTPTVHPKSVTAQSELKQGKCPDETIEPEKKLIENGIISDELVYYMLHNRDVYEEVRNKIGNMQTSRQSLQEFVTLVENLQEKYNWQPSTLFAYLDNQHSREILAALLQRNVPEEYIPDLAAGCINALLIKRVQQTISEKKAILSNSCDKNEKTAILGEIVALQRQIRTLRQEESDTFRGE